MKEIRGVQAENFNLPICPNCNETKNISMPSTITLEAGACGDYYCSACDLLWHRNKPYTDIDRIDRI